MVHESDLVCNEGSDHRGHKSWHNRDPLAHVHTP